MPVSRFLKVPERAKLEKRAFQPVYKRSRKGPNWPKGPVSRFLKGPGKSQTGQKGQSAGFKKVPKRTKLAKRASQPVSKRSGKGKTGQKGQSAGFLKVSETGLFKTALPWPFGPVWHSPGLFKSGGSLALRASLAQTRVFS